MPTIEQIESASRDLSSIRQMQVVSLIRGTSRYQAQPGLYPNLVGVIAAASGTDKGKQLNAALALIDSVGDGTVGITGGGDGLDYSQPRDRDQLIGYMLDCLYDQPLRKSSVATGHITGGWSGHCTRCGLVQSACLCGIVW